MSWEDSSPDNGIIDGTNIDEDDLFISKDGEMVTLVCDDGLVQDPGCDKVANTFSVQVESLSEFVLATFTKPIIGSISVEPNLVPVSQTISASATFDGKIDNSISASWDWGDGSTSPATIAEGKVSGSHAYLKPGVNTIKLTLSNEHAGSYTEIYQFVVVYDPGGGFVTGGGWFDSPAGAYTPDPSLSGKATFGFVSKYRKGASIPDGNTEFQFKGADLNFKSNNYDWLVVNKNDSNAQFKGTGTINGEGEYKFMIWAEDGEPDTFRIKIWEEVEGIESVIYDNGTKQPISGGSIVVHNK